MRIDQVRPFLRRSLTVITGLATLAAVPEKHLLAQPDHASIAGASSATHNPSQVGTPAPGTATGNASNGNKGAEVVTATILSSRGTVSRDGSYGVYADIQNISSEPIILRANETVLVVQPEVSHPVACVDWASGIFPTQSPSTTTPKTTGNAEIRILPNEHYLVFWDLSPRSPQTNGMCPWDSKAKDIIGFVPGDYAFTVEGIARTQPTDPSGAPSAHTFTATTTLKVGLSLVLTAIAAFLGGILAYLVVFLQPGQDFDKWRPTTNATGRLKVIAVWLRNGLAAGLLASSVTIVASRLSDTQFPVKVSVNDFWGALTIGFFSYFLGARFIKSLADKLIASTGSHDPDDSTTPSGTTPGSGLPRAADLRDRVGRKIELHDESTETVAGGR